MSVRENSKSSSLIKTFIKVKTSDLFWVVTFSVLTFLSAQVAIPVEPVPFTLQTMLVLLSGAFLGSRNGAYSQILYLAMGVIGLPVFANFSFGFLKLFGPTGGYLLSFPFAAFLTGYVIEKTKNKWGIFAAMFSGGALILLAGSAYLSIFFGGDIAKSLFAGALIFSIWDVIKISAAFSIYLAFSKKYPKLPA